MRRCLAITLLIGTLAAAPAAADWGAGVRVQNFSAQNGLRNAQVFDLANDDLMVVGWARGGSQNFYCVQRVGRTGVIAPGYPANGVPMTEVSGSPLEQSFVPDPDGTLWRSFRPSTVGAQYVSTAAVLTPTAFPNYYSVTSSSGPITRAAPIPGEGLYVMRADNRIHRITRTGAYGFGWTSTGLALPGTGFDDFSILPDGSGGAVVFMRANGFPPRATRVDSTRIVHAGWPAGGLTLSSITTAGVSRPPALVPSGASHFIACWSTSPGGGDQVRMQRFGLDGTLDPSWPADGVVVGAPDTLTALTFLSDGVGGAYALRHDNGKPVASHVSASGAIVGGADVSVLDAGAVYVATSVQSQSAPDKLCAAATPDGGLLAGWGDARLGAPVTFRLRWLKPDLTPDPFKPAEALAVYAAAGSGAGHSSLMDVHSDGEGGAFVSYKGVGEPEGFGYGSLWMTHVPEPASANAPAAGPGALAMVSLLMGVAAVSVLGMRRRRSA